jgi:hypothetical protein
MSLPPVTGWLDALMLSVTAGLVTILSFLPALIGAVIILVVGWFIAGLLGRLVTSILARVGFDRAAERTGISGFITRAGVRDGRASHVIGELVKWFIRLIFLEAAAEAVHLTAITQVLNQIVLFIPNVIVAMLVIMIGALVARFVADIVRGSASEMGFSNPNLLASLARAAIMVFAVIIAVNQIGIAATLINTLFAGLVFAMALAIGLAFGLGGRETAARVWQQWYQKGQDLAPKLEDAAQSSSERAGQSSGKPAAMTAAEASEPKKAGQQPRPRVSTE